MSIRASVCVKVCVVSEYRGWLTGLGGVLKWPCQDSHGVFVSVYVGV